MPVKTLSAIAAALMLAACTAGDRFGGGQPPLKQVWQLRHMPGIADARVAEVGGTLDLRKLPQAHAKMGCNGISFDIQTDTSGTFRPSTGVSTLMYCDGRMDLEQRFNRLIEEIGADGRYRIENGRLFLGKPGQEMVFEPADKAAQ